MERNTQYTQSFTGQISSSTKKRSVLCSKALQATLLGYLFLKYVKSATERSTIATETIEELAQTFSAASKFYCARATQASKSNCQSKITSPADAENLFSLSKAAAQQEARTDSYSRRLCADLFTCGSDSPIVLGQHECALANAKSRSSAISGPQSNCHRREREYR